MKEIIIYARAGQGAITTAAILGEALFHQETYAYAFPHFGAARMGAPMNAFLRFDEKPIRLRSKIYEPDYIMIVDPTLIESEKCFTNLKKGAKALIATRESTKIPTVNDVETFALPAEKIATEIIGKPFANTVLLGALCKIAPEIKLESMLKAVEKRFVGKQEILEKNIAAMKKGYESV